MGERGLPLVSYTETPPERGTFSEFAVYERQEKFAVLVFLRVAKMRLQLKGQQLNLRSATKTSHKILAEIKTQQVIESLEH